MVGLRMAQNPEQMLSWANWLLIVAAALTLVATYAVLHFGDRVAALKDRQLESYKSDASARIAEADLKAAEANNTASTANERTKAADIKLQQLRLDSAKLQNNNLLLQEQLEHEQQARTHIEQRLAKRGLTVAEIGEIQGALYPLGTQAIDILFPKDDAECRFLAGNLSVLFQDWDVKLYEAPVGLPAQVSVSYDASDKAAEKRANAIFIALRGVGKLKMGGPFPGFPNEVLGVPAGFYAQPPKASIRIDIGYRE